MSGHAGEDDGYIHDITAALLLLLIAAGAVRALGRRLYDRFRTVPVPVDGEPLEEWEQARWTDITGQYRRRIPQGAHDRGGA